MNNLQKFIDIDLIKQKMFWVSLLLVFLSRMLYMFRSDPATLNPGEVPLGLFIFIFASYVFLTLTLAFRVSITKLAFVLAGFTLMFSLFYRSPISPDVFWNLSLVKGFSSAGLNPYLTTVNDLEYLNLEITKFATLWRDTGMTQGPLTVLVYYIPSLFSGVFAPIFVLRLIALCLIILSLYLFNLCMNKMNIADFRREYLLLLSFSPNLLIDGMLEVHNDILLFPIGLMLAYAFINKKSLLFLPLIALGFGVKYISVVLVFPIVVYFLLNKEYKTLLLSSLFSALILFLLYIPFIEFTFFDNGLIYGLVENVKTLFVWPALAVSVYRQPLAGPLFKIFSALLGSDASRLLSLLLSVSLGIIFFVKKRPLLATASAYLLMILSISQMFSWYFLSVLPFLYLLIVRSTKNGFSKLVILTLFFIPVYMIELRYLIIPMIVAWFLYYLIIFVYSSDFFSERFSSKGSDS